MPSFWFQPGRRPLSNFTFLTPAYPLSSTGPKLSALCRQLLWLVSHFYFLSVNANARSDRPYLLYPAIKVSIHPNAASQGSYAPQQLFPKLLDLFL